jgi:hypothetical protein
MQKEGEARKPASEVEEQSGTGEEHARMAHIA